MLKKESNSNNKENNEGNTNKRDANKGNSNWNNNKGNYKDYDKKGDIILLRDKLMYFFWDYKPN